jgi:hypothetical protein
MVLRDCFATEIPAIGGTALEIYEYLRFFPGTSARFRDLINEFDNR